MSNVNLKRQKQLISCGKQKINLPKKKYPNSENRNYGYSVAKKKLISRLLVDVELN